MAKKKVGNKEALLLENIDEDENVSDVNLENETPEEETFEEIIEVDKKDKKIVAKKPLSKKCKLVLQHIGFVFGIILITIVGCAIYYNSASKDLSNYYVVGSYRIISLKKVCPDSNCELIGISTTERKSDIESKSKHYEQTVVYNFGLGDDVKTIRDDVKKAYTNKLMDLDYQPIALAEGYIQNAVMVNVYSLDDVDGYKIEIVISYDK